MLMALTGAGRFMNHRALHFARALGCWNSIQTPINTVTKFNKAMEVCLQSRNSVSDCQCRTQVGWTF